MTLTEFMTEVKKRGLFRLFNAPLSDKDISAVEAKLPDHIKQCLENLDLQAVDTDDFVITPELEQVFSSLGMLLGEQLVNRLINHCDTPEEQAWLDHQKAKVFDKLVEKFKR